VTNVVANVAVNVDARRSNNELSALDVVAKRAQAALDSLQQTAKSLRAGFDNANAAVQRLGRNLEDNTRKLQNQTTTIQSLVGAYAGFRALKGTVAAGVELESAQKRAELLTQRFGQLVGIQEIASQSADKFRLAQTDVLKSLIDLGNRLGPQGASLNEIRDVFDGFNTVLAINKVSTTEAAAAQLQLNQALGAGKLQGDEFRSVNEATPQVIDAVAKILNIARGEVKEFAAEGKVTAPILIQALRSIKEQGADVLEQSFDTAGGRIREFEKAQTELAQAVGTELLPAFTPLIKSVTDLIRGFAELPRPIRQVSAGILAVVGALAILSPAITTAIGLLNAIGIATVIAAGPWIALAAGIAAATLALANYQTQSQQKTTAIATKAATGDLGALAEARNQLVGIEQDISLIKMEGTGRRGAAPRSSRLATKQRESQELRESIRQGEALNLSAGTPDGLRTSASSEEDDKDAKRAAKERAQLEARIRGIRMETESTKQLSFIRGKIAQAEIAGDQQLAIRLQGEERNQQILQEYQNSLQGVTSEREKQALFSKAQAQIEASGIQTATELERLQADRAKAIEEAMIDIANQIALEGQLTEEGRRQVEIEQKVQEFKKANKGVTDAQVAAYRLANQELDKTQKKTKAIKAEQQALDALYGGISSQIANGVGGAIDAVTSSTENLGQALANIGQEILAAVGKMLIFYALAQAFGALGGKDGKGIFSYLARGFGGDPKALGFAEGGFVTGPTNALIGEAGNEYVIPASKMRGAMNRYAAGARGSAVIPAGDSEGGMGGTATLAPGAIDVRYTVERINTVDYVTADQFQRGMAQAAQQGAAQGEQRTLRKLQMSTSTRKRLGM